MATTSFLTVGYVVWTIRGGMLLTSILAQMPAWRIIDPLVVLDYQRDGEDGDEESLQSLESIIDDHAKRSADQPETAEVA